MSVKEAILEQVSGIEARLAERVAAAEKAAEAKVAAVEAAAVEKISALEAKIASASPAVIRAKTSLVGDNNRRLAEQLDKFVKGELKPGAEIKRYESADQALAIQEASALTGSGDGKGGRVGYDPVFTALRQVNPLRDMSRVVAWDSSSYQFRTKTGNAGARWGYTVDQTNAAGNNDTAIWTIVLKDLNARFDVRTAALSDIDGLESNLAEDMMREFAEVEAYSMQQNNDQAGSGGVLGGTDGLRGLDNYPGQAGAYTGGAATSASFSHQSGSGTGLHNIATLDQVTTNAAGATSNITFADLVSLMHVIPAQYWGGAEWLINRTQLGAIRSLRDNNGAPIFDRNDTLARMGYAGELLGFPVRVSNYADSPVSAGTAATQSLYPVYFGDFKKSHTIVDNMSMTMRRFDQTVPGSITFYGEKRLANSIVDPFAIARLRSTATGVVVGAPAIGPGQ